MIVTIVVPARSVGVGSTPVVMMLAIVVPARSVGVRSTPVGMMVAVIVAAVAMFVPVGTVMVRTLGVLSIAIFGIGLRHRGAEGGHYHRNQQ